VLAAAPDPFADAARLFQPVADAASMALAVSGGSDSLALMHLAAAWRQRPPVTVLTVDHGLRAASAEEARQVGRWAVALGLAHVVLRWEGEKPATGLQARARAARYDLMSAWCKTHGCSVLLTAHTMDDQAETVLMRLSRTTSLDSLAGIPRRGAWAGVRLFRPLLSLRREALRAALAARGVSWIDDPSNADPRFERVRVRSLLPGLAAAGVTPDRLADLADSLRLLTDELWATAGAWVAREVTVFPSGFGEFPLPAWQGEPPLLRARILGLLIARFGAGDRPEPAELAHLAAVLDRTGARRTLGGAMIARRRHVVLVGREPGRIAAGPLTVPAFGAAEWDGRFAIRAPEGSEVAAAGSVPCLSRDPGLPAFVFASLPAVRVPNEPWAVPGLEDGGAAWETSRPSARFLR
jgi:tRNA(Ile)-lysidine synthase